jgi:hypothetical protein
MVRDEAPAATAVASTNSGNSFVAAEIHQGSRPAGINDDWPHCNIQVACHVAGSGISFNVS